MQTKKNGIKNIISKLRNNLNYLYGYICEILMHLIQFLSLPLVMLIKSVLIILKYYLRSLLKI